MPTPAATYEQADYAVVSEALGGWTPSPAPSANWKGVVHEIESFPTDPAPVADLSNPTCFVVWDLTYERFDVAMDTSAAPVRFGYISTVTYSQPGADMGPVLAVAAGLRGLFAPVAFGHLRVSPDLALPRRIGRRGPWYLRGLLIPFASGGPDA